MKLKQIRGIVIIVLLGLFAIVFSGCTGQETVAIKDKRNVTDSIGRQVEIPDKIERVVVANRYNVEVIKSLGVIDKIIGVDYGIYQDQEAYGKYFKQDQVIGKNQNDLNYEKIIALQPQLLIISGNGMWEDAEKKLQPFGISVVVVDAYYTDKFAETYSLVGQIFHKEQEAKAIIEFFKEKLSYIQAKLQGVPRKTVYFEYKQAGLTTIPQDYFYNMIEYAYAENIFKTAKNTNINIEAVVEKNPEAIIKVGETGVVPSCVAPTEQEFIMRKHLITNRAGWEQIRAVKNDKILLLSQFAHGGVAKLVGTMYVAKFLYPEYLPDLHPEEIFKVWVTKYQGLNYTPGHSYPRFELEQ